MYNKKQQLLQTWLFALNKRLFTEWKDAYPIQRVYIYKQMVHIRTIIPKIFSTRINSNICHWSASRFALLSSDKRERYAALWRAVVERDQIQRLFQHWELKRMLCSVIKNKPTEINIDRSVVVLVSFVVFLDMWIHAILHGIFKKMGSVLLQKFH